MRDGSHGQHRARYAAGDNRRVVKNLRIIAVIARSSGLYADHGVWVIPLLRVSVKFNEYLDLDRLIGAGRVVQPDVVKDVIGALTIELIIERSHTAIECGDQ